MGQAFTKAIDLLYLAKQKGVDIILNDDQLQLKLPKNKNIDKALLDKLKDNKKLIIDFLKEHKKISKNDNEIKRFDREKIKHLPLSFSQERLWFIDRMEGSVQYHIPAVLRLTGKLNKEALANALQNIISRHEVLRSVFLEEEGRAHQSIRDAEGWHLEMIEGSLYKEDHEGLQQYIQELIREPFDLSKDYMVRAHLVSISEQDHVLVVTMHHIASDGWSISIIVKEVVELYAAYVEHRPAKLSSLPIQYADYAIWQRNYLQGEILDKKLTYWKQKLEGVATLQLPTDHQRPGVWSSRGASRSFTIEKKLSEQIQEFSQQQGTTLFMTLLAAFKVLLHRYSGQQDICVGTPTANRTQHEVEGLIGFFVNTLPLRTEINAEAGFTELLQQVKATTLEAYEHQDVPFEKVVEVVVKGRDLSRNPLFQVMFSLQNTPEVSQLHLGEVQLFGKTYENLTAQFDIGFGVTETANGLQVIIQYSTDLYNEPTIVRMMGHYKELLLSILKNPHQKIGELQMLTKTEEQQLLIDFNNTDVDYPKDKTIVDFFEEQVAKTPRAIAVVVEKKQLTYQQLNEKANQLSHYLRSRGVKEETLVPICIERSLEMIVAILGILKAGGAYVPVDPEYPEERIKYMLQDTGAALVISSPSARATLQAIEGIDIMELDTTDLDNEPKNNLAPCIASHHLAYVIYTSGSTGQPKGVMVEHQAVLNYILTVSRFYAINSDDFVLQQCSISFDTSIDEIFPVLINGGCLCIMLDGGRNIEVIKQYIESGKATFISTTPMVVDELNKQLVSTGRLKYVVSGGEVLLKSSVDQLFGKVKIANGYGPTETTIGVTMAEVKKLSEASLVGMVMANSKVYILDNKRKIVPIGVSGEIFIGGIQVARGYLNNEELTNERFLNDFINNSLASRLYRTGDLARWLPDGNIEYLGRLDEQVKIRGYRIELGEIETVLRQSGLIKQCVVTAEENKEGNKRLVGYIVVQGTRDREAIAAYLKAKLPEYMVPTLWVELQSLPLTPNGKIDRKALPRTDAVELSGREYVAPRNEIEEKLAAIWTELLGVNRVGVNDNFFELGGHSLLVTRVISAIRKELQVELSIKDLFQYTTINDLGHYIEWDYDFTKELDTSSLEEVKI